MQALGAVLLFCLAVGASQPAISQSYRSIDAASAALGGADVVSRRPSSLHNPSAIAEAKQGAFQVGYYHVLGYSLFSTAYAGVVMPVSFGVWGAQLFHFGNTLYSESQLSLLFAKKLGSVQLGGRGSYWQIRAEGSNTYTAFSLDAGAMVQLTSNLYLATLLNNFTQTSYSEAMRGVIPIKVALGAGYWPLKELGILLSASKQAQSPMALHAGLAYQVRSFLVLRTGIRTYPASQHFGTGVILGRVGMDYAVVRYPYLPFSHNLSLKVGLR